MLRNQRNIISYFAIKLFAWSGENFILIINKINYNYFEAQS